MRDSSISITNASDIPGIRLTWHPKPQNPKTPYKRFNFKFIKHLNLFENEKNIITYRNADTN